MGWCLTVRGPSNSQAGRNGITNMAIKAARPAHGMSVIMVLLDVSAPKLAEALAARSVGMPSITPARAVPGSPSRALFVHRAGIAPDTVAKRDLRA
jgi:hypothetical protein